MSPTRVASGVETFLDRHIEAGDLPGGVALVGRGDAVLLHCARGRSVQEPETHDAAPDTIYDLAELTQPLVTAPLILLLHALEGIDLDARMARFLPELDRIDKHDITLRDLLLHRAGLPDRLPLYVWGSDMAATLRVLGGRAPLHRPGARVLPSSIGALLLGEVAARAGSAPLDRLASELLFEPLGARTLGFGPLPAAGRPRVAATERGDASERERAGREAASYRGWRTDIIWGEVHDHIAWTLGGVSGHAGLFGAARDVWLCALEYLGRGRGLLPERLLPLVREDATPEHAEGRTHAWQVARSPGSSAGEALPAQALGHAGFTGSSIWLDPRAGRVFILLTNRVHPAVKPIDMDAIRREYHSVAAALA